MQSTSQKANSFQSVFGIFLHACRAPEKVVETLAHMGISISMTAIYDAIKSLSVNARCALLNLGKTMCFAITYDNVDVLLKTSVLTVEKTTENLRHLKSGLFFLLMHGVKSEDLKCSRELWEKSPFNPDNVDGPFEKKTYLDLATLLQDDLDVNGMTAQDCFVAWLFLRDLCTYGLDYFKKLLNDVKSLKQYHLSKQKSCWHIQWKSITRLLAEIFKQLTTY
jgi:hypothetical protein